MPSFPIFLQKLRKESAAPLFFFLFFSCLGNTQLSPCQFLVLPRICSSCGGRRCHSESHESLLRGQSDHPDRDAASTGMGGRAGGPQVQAKETGMTRRGSDIEMCVTMFALCLCLHARGIDCAARKGVHLRPEKLHSHRGMQTL